MGTSCSFPGFQNHHCAPSWTPKSPGKKGQRHGSVLETDLKLTIIAQSLLTSLEEVWIFLIPFMNGKASAGDNRSQQPAMDWLKKNLTTLKPKAVPYCPYKHNFGHLDPKLDLLRSSATSCVSNSAT